jgi:indole-3-glycerol phosphate synthase/phosphoribosylanthranilate isomerase
MFLDRIVTQTVADLEQRKREVTLADLQQRAATLPPPRDLAAAFSPRSRVHLIAEVKRASPSKGLLAPDLDPVATARLYEANGAAAISVLTEPHFFLGSPEYLTAIKAAVQVPVLRKDFIVDPYQVYEARAWGADALLLICAILDDRQLRQLLTLAHDLQMRCLVEVHSREEAERAVAAGAQIIGVNSRDLVTFKMNPYLLRELRQIIPADRIVIAESGIHSAADARRLARYDVQAMLVGESLVVSPDIPAHIRRLLQAANESVQVKICGLRFPEHVNAAVEAGADLLGAIFYEPSHRYITPLQVQELVQASTSLSDPAPGKSTPDLVGVFVNKDVDFINAAIDQAGLHFVQLHGTESPELLQLLILISWHAMRPTRGVCFWILPLQTGAAPVRRMIGSSPVRLHARIAFCSQAVSRPKMSRRPSIRSIPGGWMSAAVSKRTSRKIVRKFTPFFKTFVRSLLNPTI